MQAVVMFSGGKGSYLDTLPALYGDAVYSDEVV